MVSASTALPQDVVRMRAFTPPVPIFRPDSGSLLQSHVLPILRFLVGLGSWKCMRQEG
jgi:hypothetical protein